MNDKINANNLCKQKTPTITSCARDHRRKEKHFSTFNGIFLIFLDKRCHSFILHWVLHAGSQPCPGLLCNS